MMAAGPASAALNVAGDLLVDLDASGLPDGTVSFVTNNGTLSGVFSPFGDAPVRVVPMGASGVKGLVLDSHAWMEHTATPGGTRVPAAAGLVGANPTCSIEAWVINPTIEWEETIVAWGKRDMNCGNNMAFNYGSDGGYGAVGHWCWDLGWNGAPAAGQWHHLVYTYDGTTVKVYADGVLKNQMVSSFTTETGTAVTLGAQHYNDGVGVPTWINGSLVLARVRVHDAALTDADVLNNYNVEAGTFVLTGSALPAAPTHRYSFNNAPGDASGQTVSDTGTPGGGDAVVRGSPTTFTGTKVSLGGGSSATAAYVDLPNGLLSSMSTNNSGPGKITLEGWVSRTGNQSWARLLDFGNTAGGELGGPGGGGAGNNYFCLGAQIGGDLNFRRLEIWGGGLYDFKSFLDATAHHFVATWDEATGEILVYLNGVQAARMVTTQPMSFIQDVNVWLGRSNWTADSNLQGDYDEFRVYNYLLTPAQVQRNYQSGPDAIVLAGVAASVSATPASSVGVHSATLNGQLLSATAPTDITIYYGTSDGGNNKSNWETNVALGTLPVGTFAAPVAGLAANSTYFYRSYASNANGEAWSLPISFATLSPATFQTTTPITVTPLYARPRVQLLTASRAATEVRLYWATNDGGANTADWTNVVSLGTPVPGMLAPKLAGLAPATTYYYRFYATNEDGEVWSASTQTLTTQPVFDPAGFNYYLDFTVTGYTQPEMLTNFPVEIVFGSGLAGFDYGTVLSAGAADLRFVEMGGGELNYEVDTWDTGGNSVLWVQAPELTNGTVLRAYWGKSGQTAPVYTSNGATWEEGFAAVWHMNTSLVPDATGHGWNAHTINTPAAVTATPGQVGTAQDYNSAAGNGTTEVGNMKLTNMTLSAWVWLRETSREGIFMAKDGDLFFWQQGTGLRQETYPWGGDTIPNVGDAGGAGQWFHMAATVQGNVQAIYLNGVQFGSAWNKTPPNPGDNQFCIGGVPWGRIMNGKLDELRAERAPRSPAWIWASWKNQSAPPSFYTAGALTYIGPPILNLITPTIANIGPTNATLGGTVTTDGGNGVLVWGTVWDTTPAPTANALEIAGPGTAPIVFTQDRIGLSPGTHYYFRAWASNAVDGIKYSSDRDFYTEPDAATAVAFSALSNVSFTVGWTPPTPSAGCLVVVRRAAAVSAGPVDGTTYAASAFFGLGAELAPGEYVVHAGPGTSVNVTGLYPGETYHIAVFAYAGSGALLNYQQLTPATGSQTTANRQGPLAVAGDLLVDLNIFQGLATNVSGLVTYWTNLGTLGGEFAADGDDTTKPPRTTAGGLPCLSFDGVGEGDHLRASFPAPASMTGTAPNFTVELWMNNPSIATEEWAFGWARGWTCQRHAGIGYGNHPAFGIVAHWCDPDMGFDGGIPAAGVWHHIVVTMDSATMMERVYVDGALNAQESKTGGAALDIWPGDPVTLGNTLNGDLTYRGGIAYSGSINALRVHSLALTAEQVAANYQLGPRFALPSEDVQAQVARSGDDVTITFNSVPGLRYKVEYATSLPAAPEAWTEVFPGVEEATGTTTSVTDYGAVISGDAQRFYRVVQEP